MNFIHEALVTRKMCVSNFFQFAARTCTPGHPLNLVLNFFKNEKNSMKKIQMESKVNVTF